MIIPLSMIDIMFLMYFIVGVIFTSVGVWVGFLDTLFRSKIFGAPYTIAGLFFIYLSLNYVFQWIVLK